MRWRVWVAAALLWHGTLFAQTALFDEVEKAHVGLGDYTLGKALSAEQKRAAEAHRLPANVEGTYKFSDGDLFVVADAGTDRVVVLYRYYAPVDSATLKRLVGEYIGRFEEPTTVTHGNIIYWFYRADGTKVTLDDFEQWRAMMSPAEEAKKGKSLLELLEQQNGGDRSLGHVVTVKLSTDKSFDPKEAFLDGSAYLMISSEALLREQYNLKH